MRQIQIGQFDPARLLTYLLSRLVEAHAVEEAGAERTQRTQLPCGPKTAAVEILKTAERAWPSRYY